LTLAGAVWISFSSLAAPPTLEFGCWKSSLIHEPTSRPADDKQFRENLGQPKLKDATHAADNRIARENRTSPLIND
jgi:hypothetical protein